MKTKEKNKTELLREIDELRARLAEADAFRIIVDTINEGALTLRDDGTILYANRSYSRIIKLPLNTIIGSSFFKFIAQSDMDGFLRFLDRCIEGESDTMELQLKAFDGTCIPAGITARPFRTGDTTGACIVISDLSELEAMEQELKESEKELRMNKHFIERIANTTPNILHVYDIKERQNVYSNNQMRNILGYSTDEIGNDGTGITVHPDDYDTMVEYLKKMAKMKTGQVGEIEYRAKHASGEWRWLRSRHVVFSRNTDRTPRRLLATTEDITDRKRIQEDKERFTEIIEAASDMVSFADLDLRIGYINSAGRRILGIGESEDISGLHIYDMHPEWSNSLVRNIGIPTAMSEGMWIGETAVVNREGKEIPLSQVIIAHKGAQGKVEYLSTIARDISERKRAEAALRESEEFHRVTLGNISDAVFITTDSGILTYIGPNVEKVFGYSPAEVQAMGDINTLLGQSLFRLRDLDSMGELWNIEKQIVTKSGEERILLLNIKRVSIHGGTILYIGRDITERKLAEIEVRKNSELLERMFSNIHVKIAYMDNKFNFIRVNNAYAEADEHYPGYYVGKNHFDLFPNEDNEMIFRAVIDSGEPYFVFAKPFVYEQNPERGVTYWDWGLQPVKEMDGRVSGLILSLIDVTRRKRAEAELVKLNEELEEKVVERTAQYESANTKLREEIVERTRAQRALMGSNMRLALLSDIARLLLSSAAPHRIVNTICDKVLSFLDCQVFFNYLVDKEAGRLKLNAYKGIPEERARDIEWLDYGVAVCGCAARDGSRIVAENVQQNPDERLFLVKSFGMTAYAGHPLISRGRVIGTLSFGTNERLSFTDEELEIMQTVSDQVAIAIDRVRIYEAEKRRAGELEAVISSITDPVIIYSPEGAPVKINEAASAAYGMSAREFNALGPNARSEFIQRHSIRHTDGSTVSLPELASTKALDGSVVINEHFLFTDAEGVERVIRASAAPVYAEGAQIGAVMTWHDITELELAEEKLRRYAEEQTSLLEGSRAILRNRDFPETAQAIFGSCRDFIGATGGYVALLSEDGAGNEVVFLESGGLPCTVDPSLGMPIRGIRGEVLKSGTSQYHNDFSNTEWRSFLPEGHMDLENVLFAPLSIEGRIVGLMGLANKPGGFTEDDVRITSAFSDLAAIALQNSRTLKLLRESEEMFRQLAENIQEVFWIRDVSARRIIYISPTYEKVWGKTCESLYANEASFMESIHPEDAPLVTKEFAEQESTGSFNREYRIVRPDGSVRHIWARAFPIYDKNGIIYRRAGIARDITDKKKFEEDMFTQQKLESIGVLAGGIAHDFNNLLMAILGNITLTKMSVDAGNKAYRRLESAEKACELAKDLSYRLLTFSRGGDPVKRVVSVSRLLNESVNFALSGSNVRAEFSFADDLYPVEIDEEQFKQVIYNMVINAEEAMPGGGILKITVRNTVKKADDPLPLKEGTYLKISIEDHGTGIPTEHFSRIFDPYYTTREKGDQKGRGLGLSICHSIIKKHGGQITVESAVDAGTTFHIMLPAALREDTRRAAADTGRKRILMMDDEALIRDITGELLDHLGYETVFASHGDEALNMYIKAQRDNRPFDAVVLDLTVPGGMGGEETMMRLREMDPNVKGIVVSGYAENPVLKNFHEYGFMDAIAKPFSFDELKSVLDRMFG